MKHTNIYYICDRCGEIIGRDIPSERKGRIIKRNRRLNLQKKADIDFITENITGYVSDAYLVNHPIANAEIVESVETKTIHYYLCGKCRREFDKFMKNN